MGGAVDAGEVPRVADLEAVVRCGLRQALEEQSLPEPTAEEMKVRGGRRNGEPLSWRCDGARG